MTNRHYATFGQYLFLGLFFIFGIMFGVDPTDLSGTIAGEIVHAFYPQADILVSVAGILLTIFTFLGLIKTVRSKWERDRVDGLAAFCGFMAGGLTLIDANASILFWIGGILTSVL